MDRSARVLFIDTAADGAEHADRLAAESDNLDVHHFESAADGIAFLDKEGADCIVSAYELDGQTGIELLEDARSVVPAVPFVVFAARGSEAVASETFAAGGTGYLTRGPEQYPVLAERLEAFVTQRQSPNEREYHTLVEMSPAPMLVVDSDLTVLYANPSAGTAIGDGDTETLLGESVLGLVPPEDREDSLSRLERVFEDREPAEVMEYRYLTLGGKKRYARGTIVPVTFEGTVAAQIVLEDITDRKRRDQRRTRRRQQIERLHDVGVELAGCQSPEAAYQLTVDAAEDILDLDLCIVGIVEDDRLTLGASSEEMSDDGYIEPPLDSEAAGLAGKAYQDSESYLIGDLSEEPDANPVQNYRSSLITPIGEYGTFQAVSYEADAFSETELELVKILGRHARESLARLEQEAQLRERRDQLTRENERLDEFASIVSHDLRNPLNVVKGRLNHLREQHETEHLDVAVESAERMETLITDLLTLAREGQAVSEYETVELVDIVERSWENVDTEDASLAVETDLVIEADANRTQELLENLLRNSVEHASPGLTGYPENSITVSVGDLEDGEGFYVEDDGPGIPPGERDRVFDSGFTTSEDGTGFGLAIVNRIAEAHGWNVTVTAGSDGGARFELSDVDLVWG